MDSLYIRWWDDDCFITEPALDVINEVYKLGHLNGWCFESDLEVIAFIIKHCRGSFKTNLEEVVVDESQ